MATLDRIANVQIDLHTTGVQQLSFSDMIILGPHQLGLNRTMIITEVDDLTSLGMSTTDPIYLAAQDGFSQIPSVRQIYIGRMNVADATVGFGSITAGQTYILTLGWLTGTTAFSPTVTFTYYSGRHRGRPGRSPGGGKPRSARHRYVGRLCAQTDAHHSRRTIHVQAGRHWQLGCNHEHRHRNAGCGRSGVQGRNEHLVWHDPRQPGSGSGDEPRRMGRGKRQAVPDGG
jgi:hypothetical protein